MKCKSCGNPVSIKMEYALRKNVCPYCSNEIMSSNNLQQSFLMLNSIGEIYEQVKNINNKDDVVDAVIDFLLEKFTLVSINSVPEKEPMQTVIYPSKRMQVASTSQIAARTEIQVKEEIQETEVAEEVKGMSEAEAAAYMQKELEESLQEDTLTTKSMHNKVEMSTDLNNDDIERVRQMILANANQKGEMPLNLENGGEEMLMGALAQHGLSKVCSGSSIKAKRTDDNNFEPVFAGKNKSIQRLS